MTTDLYPKPGDVVRMPKGTIVSYPIDPVDKTEMQHVASALHSAAHGCGAKVTVSVYRGVASSLSDNKKPVQDFLTATVLKKGRERKAPGRKSATAKA